MSSFGTFSGNPKTEWVTDDTNPDRNMILLDDFSYTDPNGKVWLAPKGRKIDGASIPRPLWMNVGSPYTDDYRRASVVHDIACEEAELDSDPKGARKEADVMFYYACLAGGCSYAQAKVLYAGVRIGAWGGDIFSREAISKKKLLFRFPMKPLSEEVFLQSKFQEIAKDLQSIKDDAGIVEIDNVINKHIKQ
jgi:hypothetical protein